MKINQYGNGDAEIIFSKAEAKTISKTGRLFMEDWFFKQFTNILVKMVVDANGHFNEKVKKDKTAGKGNSSDI